MILSWLFLGCFDSSPEEKKENTEEVQAEKKTEYRIDRVEEFHVSHIYTELPEYVYAANEGINLRNRSTANSSVLAKIPLGAKIQVLSKDKEETLGSRTDHWYQVRYTEDGKAVDGFLFGSTLTPHALRADWDGDGKDEHMFVMFNERRELLVRIADPNGDNTWSNMSAYGEEENVVEHLTVKLLHKEVAGLPLLKIEASNESQSFFWTKYVSYHHGKLLRALEYTEEESAESYQKKEPNFGPKKLSMHVVDGLVQADGSEKQTVITKRYRYRSGVFVEKNVSEPKHKVLPPQTTN